MDGGAERGKSEEEYRLKAGVVVGVGPGPSPRK